MKRYHRKYIILLVMILAAATGIVFGVSYLRNHQIKQPQGDYMKENDAVHLESVLEEKYYTFTGVTDQVGRKPQAVSINSMKNGVADPGTGSSEWFTYGKYLEFVEKLCKDGALSEEKAEKFMSMYEGRYKSGFFMLEEDFVEAYLKLAEQIVPDDPIHTGYVTYLAGGNNVSLLEKNNLTIEAAKATPSGSIKEKNV